MSAAVIVVVVVVAAIHADAFRWPYCRLDSLGSRDGRTVDVLVVSRLVASNNELGVMLNRVLFGSFEHLSIAMVSARWRRA